MDKIKREYLSAEKEELQARGTGLRLVPAGTSPVIDPELRDLLPSITDEERESLTADILKNGCYSPMICMEDMTLVDGHHRYDICAAHDIPYRMVILDFEDKLAAMEWIIRTQKGRRNLTTYQIGQVALKLRDKIETRARAKMVAGGGDKVSAASRAGSATLPNPPAADSVSEDPIDTRKELAKTVGLGERTMGKIMKIDESAPELVKQAVAANEITVNAAYDVTRRLMELPEEEREDAAEEYVEAAKAYKRGVKKADEKHDIAVAINRAMEQAGKMEITDITVRIWIDYCGIRSDAIDDAIREAGEYAEKFLLLKEILETQIKPNDCRRYEDATEEEAE